MAEGAEVRVRLVVDSNSTQIAEGMKKDLKGVDQAAHAAGKSAGAGLGGGLKAGAIAMGNIYAELAKEALHLGKEALSAPIEAFLDGEKVVRSFAGTFALIDQGGNSMEELARHAKDVKSELTTMAMAAGVADSAIFDVFTNIIERGGKSVEEAEELTKAVSFAGKAIPGGPAALGTAFEMIQMGMIRAKNPIAGMISATGLLKGSAKEVAKEMQKLSIEKQMELAEKAVTKMGAKMKNVPLTFSESLQSLSTLKEDILEEAGASMAPGITKVVDKIRGVFLDSDGKTTELTKRLYQGAADFGEFLAEAFELGQNFIDGFASGLTVANEEFKIIWKEVFGDSDQTFKNMVEYVKVAGSILGAAVKMFAAGVGAVIVVVSKVIKYIIEAVGLAAELLGKVSGSQGIASFGTQAQKLAFSSEQGDRLSKLSKTGSSKEDSNKARQEYIATAGFTGESDYMVKLAEADAARKSTEDAIASARVAETTGNAAQFYEAFAKAKAMNDDAAMTNIASFLKNNIKMAEAIGKLGPEIIGDARDAFAKALEQTGSKEAAVAFTDANRTKLKVSKANVTQNFTGAINVKQDFKDQDPDRVIVAFKQKLSNVGSSRLQARTASPFGF